MRRQVTIAAGLLVVLAFAIFARTAGPGGGQPAASAPSTVSGPGGGGGGGGAGAGLPLGAPQSGPQGTGFVTISGAVRATYRFKQISCIHSPNSPNGLLAKGTSDPTSPSPVTIGVATDASTLSPIELQLPADRSWGSGQRGPKPQIRRAGKTVTFAGQLRSEGRSAAVSVRGSITCGAVITLG